MDKQNDLQRFIDAQQTDYPVALAEIKNGNKRSHWMWYIFPQIKGLGFSETSMYYGIRDAGEAADYLNHPLLGIRLVEISNELLKLKNKNASQILGSPDDMKLKSAMTLFAALPNADPVFQSIIDQYFNGSKDQKTLQLLNQG